MRDWLDCLCYFCSEQKIILYILFYIYNSGHGNKVFSGKQWQHKIGFNHFYSVTHDLKKLWVLIIELIIIMWTTNYSNYYKRGEIVFLTNPPFSLHDNMTFLWVYVTVCASTIQSVNNKTKKKKQNSSIVALTIVFVVFVSCCFVFIVSDVMYKIWK